MNQAIEWFRGLPGPDQAGVVSLALMAPMFAYLLITSIIGGGMAFGQLSQIERRLHRLEMDAFIAGWRCHVCKGSRYIDGRRCDACDGTGI